MKSLKIAVQKVSWINDGWADSAEITLQETIQNRVSLPVVSDSCDPGQEVIVAGFGIDETNSTTTQPKIGYYTQLKDESRREVFEGQSDYKDRPAFNFYQASGRAQVCFGDSGGIVYCRSHGRLSIAATTTSIGSSYTLKGGIYARSKFCKFSRYLHAFPIETTQFYIQNWHKYDDVEWANPGQK